VQAPKDPEAHWILARIEEKQGNLNAARKEMQYLLKHNPNKQEYLEAAARLEFQAYLSQRSLVNPRTAEKALTYLHRLLGLGSSKKDRIYRDIARIHAADRDYKSAMSYLEKAAAYAQKNKGEFQPDAHWLEAANMALEMDDLKTAIAYVRKTLVFNPENSAAKKSLRQLLQLTQMGPIHKSLLLEGNSQ